MNCPCFSPTLAVTRSEFLAGSPLKAPTRPTPQVTSRTSPRAQLPLIPGVPPGEDARDNAPMRYFVPRPVETYDDRGFATILPRTWEGETNTIGASDIAPLTKESIEESRAIQVTAASTGAFVDYAQMVKSEREKELSDLAARSSLGQSGRATCGEEEGKAFVSNYRTVLVEGVKAVEYWGAPNGNVPRVFGGAGA